MTDEEQEQKPIQAEVVKPKLREMIVETDGTAVNMKKVELTVLEVKEVCRMLLKQLGG